MDSCYLTRQRGGHERLDEFACCCSRYQRHSVHSRTASNNSEPRAMISPLDFGCWPQFMLPGSDL